MSEEHKSQGATKTVIHVDGMSCGACARSVDRALQSVEGVHSVEVDLETHAVEIAHEGVPLDAMCEAIRGAGYRPRD